MKRPAAFDFDEDSRLDVPERKSRGKGKEKGASSRTSPERPPPSMPAPAAAATRDRLARLAVQVHEVVGSVRVGHSKDARVWQDELAKLACELDALQLADDPEARGQRRKLLRRISEVSATTANTSPAKKKKVDATCRVKDSRSEGEEARGSAEGMPLAGTRRGKRATKKPAACTEDNTTGQSIVEVPKKADNEQAEAEADSPPRDAGGEDGEEEEGTKDEEVDEEEDEEVDKEEDAEEEEGTRTKDEEEANEEVDEGAGVSKPEEALAAARCAIHFLASHGATAEKTERKGQRKRVRALVSSRTSPSLKLLKLPFPED